MQINEFTMMRTMRVRENVYVAKKVETTYVSWGRRRRHGRREGRTVDGRRRDGRTDIRRRRRQWDGRQDGQTEDNIYIYIPPKFQTRHREYCSNVLVHRP